MNYEILIRRFDEFEGDGKIDIEPVFGGRLLCAQIMEDYRWVVITARNQADLDEGIKSYKQMRPSLPTHRPLRIVVDDDKTTIVPAD